MQILHNAQIYTMDNQLSTASAMVVDQGYIRAIGDQKAILLDYGESYKRINLQGRTVIPGLTDAHIHLQHYALSLQKVDCETGTREQCLQNVAKSTEITSPGEWILGHGWNQNEWQEGFGDAEQLDLIAPSHPIYLTAKSLHAAWVNSAALKQAGITAQTPDPLGGRIDRREDGSPSGILFETAMSLVADVIPPPSIEEVAKGIDDAQEILWRMGVTAVHDFDRRTCFMALQQLHKSERLKIRVIKSLPIESLSLATDLGLQTGFGDDQLRIGSVKAFADGALGPRTAAMLKPFEGEPENRGLLMMDAEDVYEQGMLAVENGLSLAVHAIGDSANHEVLQAFTQLREYEKQHTILFSGREVKRPLRHRIEHVQLIHPDDLSRLAELGVIASMQPIHATSDFPAADKFWGDRSKFAYAWRSLQEAGTQLAFGSDAPVESPNPFWGLHAALTRRRSDGSPGEDGWYPEQKISLTTALQGYTRGAAYAANMESRQGQLAPGFFADLIVLDEDLYQVEPDEIREIKPVGTMIGGKWVHLDSSLDLLS
jgi:predicted amidohydrolase YtcJ